MAKPRLPLTPASSADISAMDKSGPSPAEMYFALPPAALPEGSSSNQSTSHVPITPISPEITASSQKSPRASRQRKRSAAEINLPPPPSRTRKIIQVKPKMSDRPARATNASEQISKKQEEDDTAAPTPSSASKTKKGNGTTAAGRKIARKTAHSLIERRRRSKMNEEFATLKDMIPACRGQEMHKLSILQASIEYMNYLEQCISDLKAANKSDEDRNDSEDDDEEEEEFSATTSPILHNSTSNNYPEPLGTRTRTSYSYSSISPSPNLAATSTSSYASSTQVSPNFGPHDNSRHKHHPSSSQFIFESIPSANASLLPSPSLAPRKEHNSTTHFPPTSPHFVLDPQLRGPSFPPPPQHSGMAAATSTTTSPALDPQKRDDDADMDREATAALLMLNVDRRVSFSGPVALSNGSKEGMGRDAGVGEGRRKMGISVKDLLSS